MNLIERYGYDRAKRELALMDESSIAMISDSVEYREKVRAGLLEHRRENNIFENGDKIIFSAMCNSVMNFNDCLRMFLSQGLIRHATDKEIAQGYRDE